MTTKITTVQDLIVLSKEFPSKPLSAILVTHFNLNTSCTELTKKHIFLRAWQWLRSIPSHEEQIRLFCKRLILQRPQALDEASSDFKHDIASFTGLKVSSFSIPPLDITQATKPPDPTQPPSLQATLFSTQNPMTFLNRDVFENIWGHKFSNSDDAIEYLKRFAQEELSIVERNNIHLLSQRLQASKAREFSARSPYDQVRSLSADQTYLHRISYGNATISFREVIKALLSKLDHLNLSDQENVVKAVSDPKDFIDDLSKKIKQVLNENCPNFKIPRAAHFLFPDSSRTLPKTLQSTLPGQLIKWVESVMKKGALSFFHDPFSGEFQDKDQGIEYFVQLLNSENRDQMIDEACANIQSHVDQGIVSISEFEALLIQLLNIANKLPLAGQSALNMDSFFSRGFLWFEFTKKEDQTFDIRIYGIGSHLSYLSDSFPLVYEGVSKQTLSKDFFDRLSELEHPKDRTFFRNEDIFDGVLRILGPKKQQQNSCQITHRSLVPTEFNMTMSYLLQGISIDSFNRKLKIQALIDYCTPFHQNGTLTLDEKATRSLKRILPDLQTFAHQSHDSKERALLSETVKLIQQSIQPSKNQALPNLQIDFSKSLFDSDLTQNVAEMIGKVLGIEKEPIQLETQKKITARSVIEDLIDGFLSLIQEFFLAALTRVFPHLWAIPILVFFRFLLQKAIPKRLKSNHFSDIKLLASQVSAFVLCGPSYFLTTQIIHNLLKVALPQTLLTRYQKTLAYFRHQIIQGLVHLTLHSIGEPELIEELKKQLSQLKQVFTKVFKILKNDHRIFFENPSLNKEIVLKKSPYLTTHLRSHTGHIPSSKTLSFSTLIKTFPLADFKDPTRLRGEIQNWHETFRALSKKTPALAIEYFYEQTSRLPIPSAFECPFWGSVQTPDICNALSDLHMEFALFVTPYSKANYHEDSSYIWSFEFPFFEQLAINSATFLTVFDYLCRHDPNSFYQERTGVPLFEWMIQTTKQPRREYVENSRVLTLYNYFKGSTPLPSYKEITEEFCGISTYSHPIKECFKMLLKQPHVLERLKNLQVNLEEMSEENLMTILSHELLSSFSENSPIPNSLQKLFIHGTLTQAFSFLTIKEHKSSHYFHTLKELIKKWTTPKNNSYSLIKASPILTWDSALLNIQSDPLSKWDINRSDLSHGGYFNTIWGLSLHSIGVRKAPLILRTPVDSDVFHLFKSSSWHYLCQVENSTKSSLDNRKATSQEDLILYFSGFDSLFTESIFCEPTDRMIRIMHLLQERPNLLVNLSYLQSGVYSKQDLDFYPLLFSAFFSFNHLRAQLDASPGILRVISEFIQNSLIFIKQRKDPFSYLHLVEFGIFVQVYCESHLKYSCTDFFPNWRDLLEDIPPLSNQGPSELQKEYRVDLKLKKALLDIKLAFQDFDRFSTRHFLKLCKTFFYIKIHRPSFLQSTGHNSLIKEFELHFKKYAQDFLEHHFLEKDFFMELLTFLDLSKMDLSSVLFERIDRYTYVLGPFKVDFKGGLSRTDNVPLIVNTLYKDDPLVKTIIQKEKITFSEVAPGYFESSNRRYTIQCSDQTFTLHFRHENRCYIYIENSKLSTLCQNLFSLDQPASLWLEDTTSLHKTVLIKDVSSTNTYGQIVVEHRNGDYLLTQIDSLMYVDVSYFQAQLSNLHKFCPLTEVLCLVNPNQPDVLQEIVLRPFHLTFTRKEDRMFSKEFPGFFLSEHQFAQNFPVASVLVLENLEGKRKVLLPKNQDLITGLQTIAGPRISQLALHPFLEGTSFASINPKKYHSKQTVSLSPTVQIIVSVLNIIFSFPEHFHQKVDPKFALSPKEKWFALCSSLNTIKKAIPIPKSILTQIPDEAFLLFMGASVKFLTHYQHLKDRFTPHTSQNPSRHWLSFKAIKDCYESFNLLSSFVPQVVGLFSKGYLDDMKNLSLFRGDGFDLILSRLLKCFRPGDIHNGFHSVKDFAFFSQLSAFSYSENIRDNLSLDREFVREHLFQHWLSFYSIAKQDAGEEKQRELLTSLYLLKGGTDPASRQLIDLLIEVTTISNSQTLPRIEDLAPQRSNTNRALDQGEKTSTELSRQLLSDGSTSEIPVDSTNINFDQRQQQHVLQENTRAQEALSLSTYEVADSYFEYEIEGGQITSCNLSDRLFLLCLYFLHQDIEKGQALYASLETDLKTAPFKEEYTEFLNYLTFLSLMDPTINWIRLKLSALLEERSHLAPSELNSKQEQKDSRPPLELPKDAPSQHVFVSISSFEEPESPSPKIGKRTSPIKGKQALFSNKMDLDKFVSKIISTCRNSWAKKELSKLALRLGQKGMIQLLSRYTRNSLISSDLAGQLNKFIVSAKLSQNISTIRNSLNIAPPLLYKKRKETYASSQELQKMESAFQDIFNQIHAFLSLETSFFPDSIKRISGSLAQHQNPSTQKKSHTLKSSSDLWHGYQLFTNFSNELSENLKQEKKALLDMAKEQIDSEIRWEDLVLFYIQSKSRFPISQSFSMAEFEKIMGFILLKMSWQARCNQVQHALDRYLKDPSDRMLEKVKTSLYTHRCYSFDKEFPERFTRTLLAMEVFSGQLFWDVQIELIKKMYLQISSTLDDLCLELLMGMGKTSKIFPIQNLQGRLTINIFPTSLMGPMQRNLAHSLSPFGQSLTGGIVINRQTPMTVQTLQSLFITLTEALEYGDSFCFSQQSLQALELLFLEALIDKKPHMIILLYQRILLLLKKHGTMVADEAHTLFTPREELIFPLGSKQPYPEKHFKVIHKFLECYFEIDSTFLDYISKNNLTNYPEDRFQQSCKETARKMGISFFHLSESNIGPWVDFVMGESPAPIEIENHLEYEGMCLVRGCIQVLIPIILKEPLGIKYGRSNNPSVNYAKPMEGRENVKESSTFQNPDETVIKTIIMYLSQGLSENQFWITIRTLCANRERKLNQRVPLEYIEEHQILNQYQHLDLSVEDFITSIEKASEPSQKNRIYQLLRTNPTIIFNYISTYVLFQIHSYSSCIRSTAYNLASMFERHVTMTGTPYNHEQYPNHHLIFQNSKTEAALERISRVLEKDFLVVPDEGAEKSLSILTQYLKENPNVKALIDAGAFMKNIPNREVARRLSQNLSKGVVFFDKNKEGLDEPFIYEKTGQIIPLSQSNTPAEKRLVYYDLFHCYGTDCEIPPGLVIETYSPKTPLNALEQGAFRIRALRDSCPIDYQLVLAVRPCDQEKYFFEISQQAKKQQGSQLFFENLPSYLKRIENEARRTFLNLLLQVSPQRATELASSQKAIKLIISSLTLDIKRYGIHKTEIPIDVFIKEFIEKQLHLLKELLSSEEIDRLRKQIDSLSRPPLPEKVEAKQSTFDQQMEIQVNTEQEQEEEQEQEQEQEQILSAHFLPNLRYTPLDWPSNVDPFRFDFRRYLPKKKSYFDQWFRNTFSTFHLTDLLKTSKSPSLQKLAPCFSDQFWVSCNFHPASAQFATTSQRHIYQVVIHGKHKDGVFNIRSVGCLSQKDAAYWREKLLQPNQSPSDVAILYDIHLRCIVAGSSFPLDKIRHLPEIQELEMLLHFLNADLSFSNLEKLKNWISQDPTSRSKAFLEIYRGKKRNQKNLLAASHLDFLT